MKNIIKFYCLIIALVISPGIITGCSNSVSSSVYQADQAGVASQVDRGQIVSRRAVTIENTNSAGAVSGAVAGGALGTLMGGKPATKIAGAAAGALAGGVVGHTADKKLNTTQADEYIIKLTTGKTISIAQSKDLDLRVGQHVMVIYGKTTRVVPDTTYNNVG